LAWLGRTVLRFGQLRKLGLRSRDESHARSQDFRKLELNPSMS